MSKLESLPVSPGSFFGSLFTILILLISPTNCITCDNSTPQKGEDDAWPVHESVSSLPDPGEQ